ncbi:hypothetical protein C8T65DRAFT_734978 [Cerioporus squamosus]|nr:hypothetical protein C8T65DRAFT_734978 [Cerioporus squamosus]
MTRLERLEIYDGETLLSAYPLLGEATAKLTSLHHLDIAKAGRLTCELIKVLQSNLRSIKLQVHWLDDGMDDSDDDDGLSAIEVTSDRLTEYHPVPFLAKWASTLEELVCETWYTGSDVPVFTQVYPKLRFLDIKRDDFPLSYHRWDDPFLAEGFRLHREANIRAQLASDGPGTWQHLQEFEGYLHDLHLLGLTSRISSIRFSNCITARDLDMLSVVLSCAQPLHLMLGVQGTLLNHPEHSLAMILRESGAARLESLVVTITLTEAERDADIPSLLHALASSLSRRPMRRLRLLVHARLLNPGLGPRSLHAILKVLTRKRGLPEPQSPPPAPSIPAERMLETFDVDAFVRSLGEATPSLGDAIVVIDGLRSCERRRAVIARNKVHVDPHMDGSRWDFR